MAKRGKTENELKKEKPVKTEKKKEKQESAQTGNEACETNQTTNESMPGDETIPAEQTEEKENDIPKEDDEDIQTKYMRLAADFQNFRRRTENEKKDIYAYANENIVRELLNVTDNFERAIDQAKESSDQALADGVALIYKQLKEVLEKFGMQEIPALTEPFDPNLHHAVMMDDSGEGESGHITEVFQKGYCLNGRVVRPSMVKVAQ